jgi:hypothetical protein
VTGSTRSPPGPGGADPEALALAPGEHHLDLAGCGTPERTARELASVPVLHRDRVERAGGANQDPFRHEGDGPDHGGSARSTLQPSRRPIATSQGRGRRGVQRVMKIGLAWRRGFHAAVALAMVAASLAARSEGETRRGSVDQERSRPPRSFGPG